LNRTKLGKILQSVPLPAALGVLGLTENPADTGRLAAGVSCVCWMKLEAVGKFAGVDAGSDAIGKGN